jgi:hypothetical protein
MKTLSLALMTMTGAVFAFVGCTNCCISKYTAFEHLNASSVNVSASWTRLGTGVQSFVKTEADTKIEVVLNSRLSVGAISGNGVFFEVRVDSIEAKIQTQGSVLVSSSSEFCPILAVFEGLAKGSHSVGVWAKGANGGSATDVIVDPGGWGGGIIVKETR